MKRLFSIAAVFSLLLWLLLFVAWMRSSSGSDKISFSSSGNFIKLSTGPEIDIVVVHAWPQPETFQWTYVANGEPDPRSLEMIWLTSPQTHAMLGLHIMNFAASASLGKRVNVRMINASKHPVTMILITTWFLPSAIPVIFFLPWIGLTYRNYRQRIYRRRHQLCVACGYDLRSSSDNCPECGTPIPSPSPAGRGPG